MNTDQTFTYLKIPTESWQVLEETLQMDTRSKAFDKGLRHEIESALGAVEQIQTRPAVHVDEYYEDDHDPPYLAAYLCPSGELDDSERVAICGTIVPIEELSKDAYDTFVKQAQEKAALWGTTLSTLGFSWDEIVCKVSE